MCLPSLPCCELKDVPVSRDSMPVIPANAEALYNSKAGQSSLNTLCEAHKAFPLCAAHVILHRIDQFRCCKAPRRTPDETRSEATEPLSLSLSFKQPVAISTKEVQRSAQAFHLRGTELPRVEFTGLTLRPARRFAASQQVADHAHSQRGASDAHERCVSPGVVRVKGKQGFVDEPERFGWTFACVVRCERHDQRSGTWFPWRTLQI